MLPDVNDTIAITGASGLVGSALRKSLREDGVRVLSFTRHRKKVGKDAPFWDPDRGEIDVEALEGVRGVVHLAGENVASGRWTEARKARIRDSRVHGTRLLCSALTRLPQKPEVLVSASAVGFYGDRGSTTLDESTPVGEGFLAEVCRDWEAATAPAREAGIRVTRSRIGIVLSKEGGALAKMRIPFKLGAGGKIGSGDQYMSWIALPDLVAALRFALDTEALDGPVNYTAPNPVKNSEFTEALGDALKRPTLIPVPKIAAKAAFGSEMAEEMFLASVRAIPAKLEAAGFRFRYPDLRAAFAYTEG